MVVPAHSLVAPRVANGRSMVITRLLLEHFNVFSFMSVFFLGNIHDMTIQTWPSDQCPQDKTSYHQTSEPPRHYCDNGTFYNIGDNYKFKYMSICSSVVTRGIGCCVGKFKEKDAGILQPRADPCGASIPDPPLKQSGPSKLFSKLYSGVRRNIQGRENMHNYGIVSNGRWVYLSTSLRILRVLQ